MAKRGVIKLALDGKKVPCVPWSIKFTLEPKEALQKHYGEEGLTIMKHSKYLMIILVFLFFLSCKNEQKEVVKNVINLQAESFPLSDTRLIEGSLFKHAMDKDAQWLLDLEPDRLLHRFFLNAGLEPKGEVYGGWESAGVSGHTLGHYLSACAMMYAASGDKRFKERVDYIVHELSICQKARKTGYVGAIPNEDQIWDEVSRGDIRYNGSDLNGGWAPWYTQHKVCAGLIDAYLLTDNKEAKEVAVGFTDWAVKKFGNLTEEQFQQMLAAEFGGINESWAEMYTITGNKSYLDLAEKFYHKAIMDPLKEKRDELAGKHANTQIPKIIGTARLYELTGNEDYHTISTFFWDQIVNHHSYLNGGNSDFEHLGVPDHLNDRLSANTTETCNTYNMLKLTRHLFSWNAKAAYMDYYERALYNHILASQNPDDGLVCYFVPLLSGTQKTFSSRFESFWCCVASGIENHVKYAESVFFKAEDGGLFVNLFIPTALHWKEKKMDVRLQTSFPENGKIIIEFEGKSQKFPLYIRYPKWAKNGIKGYMNNTEISITEHPGSFITINGEWGSGITLTLELPMSVYTESMPDNPNRIGLFYGPVLLSAGLGVEHLEIFQIPVFVSDKDQIASSIVPVPGKVLTFSTQTSTVPANIELTPFYCMHGQNHAVYFDVFSSDAWKDKEKEYEQAMEKHRILEEQTLDIIRIGEMQPERDHDLKSERSTFGNVGEYKYRDAYNGWFSFSVKVDPGIPLSMMCSYWGEDKEKRNFDIYIDNVLFKSISLLGVHGAKVFDVIYDIPASFTKGKKEVVVKFQSHPDNYAGGLFGFRILKK